MSKHFKNQASKRRRDDYRRRSQQGVRRLVNQIFEQSETIVSLRAENSKLKADNASLRGDASKNRLFANEREVIHDSIVNELGKKLNKAVDSRNTYRLLFWSLFTIHSVIIVIKIAVSYFIH